MAGRLCTSAHRRQARATGASDARQTNPHPYTRAFAAKGLGGLKDASAVPDADRAARQQRRSPSSSRASARSAGSAMRAAAPRPGEIDPGEGHAIRMCGWKRWRRWAAFALPASPIVLLDCVDRSESGDPCGGAADPPLRSIRNSSWRFSPDWIPIRSGACGRRSRRCSGRCRPTIALPGLTAMLDDTDQRVIPAVLAALVKLRATQRDGRSCSSASRPTTSAVRAAAATGLGEIKPADGAAGAGRGLSVRPAGLALLGAGRGARRAREVRSGRRDAGAENARWPTRTGPSACAPRCC